MYVATAYQTGTYNNNCNYFCLNLTCQILNTYYHNERMKSIFFNLTDNCLQYSN